MTSYTILKFMPNSAIFCPKNADFIKKVGQIFFHFSETPDDFLVVVYIFAS